VIKPTIAIPFRQKYVNILHPPPYNVKAPHCLTRNNPEIRLLLATREEILNAANRQRPRATERLEMQEAKKEGE
jgi:hypothetical protein